MMHPWNDACIRFATLSNYVILKLMQGWHFHRFKDPIYHNNFPHWLVDLLIDWLVEDQNQFVTWAFTIALFPLWRFLCLLIDFMLAVQSPHRAVRAQRVSLVHSRGVTQVKKPSPIQRSISKHQSWSFLEQRKVWTGLFGLLTSKQA